ncbi:MAG TPA: M56 family metallopeptidase [Terriglobia bacterium]
MTPQAIIERSPEVIRHLADPALRAIVLTCAAAVALRVLRVKSTSTQLAVWTGVLYAVLVLPLLGWLLPAVPLRVPAGRAMMAMRAGLPNWLRNSELIERTARAARLVRAAGAARALPEQRAKTAIDSLASHWAATAVSAGTSLDSGAVSQAVTPGWPRQRHTSSGWPQFGPHPQSMLKPALTPMSKAALISVLQLAVYLLVLSFLLARLGVGLVLSRRLRRGSFRISDPRALRWLEWHALAMGLDRKPVLSESTAVTVPLTLGVVRPVILIPSGWHAWENAKLSAVIAHEMAHVKRKDSLTRTLSLIYRSVFWFSPLGWWLEGRLADLAEQASDAAALGAGAEPTYYAEVLMSFFGAIATRQGRVKLQGVSMARGANAKNRIENVLSPGRKSARGPKAPVLLLMALLAAPIVYLTAATRPVLGGYPSPSPPLHLIQEAPAQPPAPAAPVEAPAPPAAPSPAVAGLGAGRGPEPIAPPAPAAPNAMPVPAPAPPAAPMAAGIEPQHANPPEAESSDNEDKDTSIFNGNREGMDFAIVKGKSLMVSGSDDDRDDVKSLQKKIPGDFIWFIHNGDSYVIRDAAAVATAEKLYEPMEELGNKQEALGKQQEELGRQQEAMGEQMEKVRVQVPSDLEARLKKLEAMIRELGSNATQEDLGRLQGELGDIQGEIGGLQGKAGNQQGSIGRRQGELGAKQGELGRQQGELGREQGRLARQASRQMQDILKRALANGSAQRAPE